MIDQVGSAPAETPVPTMPSGTRAGTSQRRSRRPTRLRRRLVTWDVLSISAAWLVPSLTYQKIDPVLRGLAGPILRTGLAVTITIIGFALLGLYRGRVCADRRDARLRMAGASALPLALALLSPAGESAVVLLTGPALSFVLVAVEREVFEQWLRSARARGYHIRPVVLAGTRDEVSLMARLLHAHPETGCRPVGYVGPPPGSEPPGDGARAGGPDLDWLGPTECAGDILHAPPVTALLAAPSVLCSARFTELARDLHRRGVLVQLWSGLWGVDPRRLRSVRLAHEAFYDLRPARSQAQRRRLKRMIDVSLASVVLIATSPVLAVAAALIKRHDGGPVLFRQKRVGQHGELIELRKLRTMAVDAESRLDELRCDNERRGPLFKLSRDPRVTPIGRVLRATSLDELPQLLDVLAGRLSLVGPRPALPSEVAEFDQALLGRHDVLPGITGLWQVEARHNPSFDAYRHLDLFYVENWNLQLDIVILLATVKTVIADSIGSLSRSRAAGRRGSST